MSEIQPSRKQSDLAETVEMILEKGVVVNADIVVTVGDTQLLGVHLRAAVASFETAAEYGLQFPAGTDPERLAAATGLDQDTVTVPNIDASDKSDTDQSRNTDSIDDGAEGEAQNPLNS